MKSTIKISSLLKGIMLFCVALAMSACSDEPLKPQATSGQVLSRGLVTGGGNASTTNPNLISDWENVSTIVLNSGETVTAPWDTNAVTSELSEKFRTDIKKSQGWIMMFHTFKEFNLDRGQSYICFYNLFTGVMKVFYYAETTKSASTNRWILSYGNALEGLKMLDQPDFFTLADNEASLNTSNRLYLSNENSSSPAFNPGWIGFEYQIPRYSSTQTLDRTFTISADSKTYLSFMFDGKELTETSGTITSITTPQQQRSDDEDSNVDGSATYNGEKATSFWEKLKGVVKFGEKVGQIAEKVTNFEKPFAKVLRLLFGRSTTVSYKTESDVRLTSTGTITLNGTGESTTNTDNLPISFKFTDAFFTSTNQLNSTSGSIVWHNKDEVAGIDGSNLNLGVWTLTERPKAYLNMIAPVNLTRIDDSNEYNLEFYGNGEFPKIIHHNLNVVFNPLITKYIKSHSVDVTFLDHKPAKGAVNIHPNGFPQSFRESNLLMKDTIHALYTISDDYAPIHRITNYRLRDIDANAKYYFYWKDPIKDRIIAMVTVTMNVDYLGNEFTVTETRAYHVDTYPDPATSDVSKYHNEPYSIVLNSGIGGAASY